MHKSEKSNNDSKRIIQMEGLVRFKERLKIAMGKMNNLDLSRRSGVSESVIRNYLAGKSYPGLDKLIALSDACGCSIEWLARGKINNENSLNMAGNSLNSNDDNLSSLLSNLSDKESLVIRNFIIREGINGLLRLAMNSSFSVENTIERTIDNLPIRETLKQAIKVALAGDESLDQEILHRITEKKNTNESGQLNQNEGHQKVG